MSALPKTLGPCIDALVTARRLRRDKEQAVKLAKQTEEKIEDHILATFEKQKIHGAKGKLGSVSLIEKDVPRVTDKEAFGKYVAKHQAWDLIYGKAVEAACQARWEVKEEIDGIEKYHDMRISLSEAK
jgi:hypothetical protein